MTDYTSLIEEEYGEKKKKPFYANIFETILDVIPSATKTAAEEVYDLSEYIPIL